MPDITREEKQARELLINRSYTYLNDNFHKFTETNKIRVALEIIKKAMPTQLEHSGEVIYTKMTHIKVEHNPMELSFGDDYRASRNIKYPGQAPADHNKN